MARGGKSHMEKKNDLRSGCGQSNFLKVVVNMANTPIYLVPLSI